MTAPGDAAAVDPRNTGGFVMVQGVMARLTGRRLADCPWPRGSARAMCWRWGFKTRENILPPKRRRNISRETNPGRGRARVGNRGVYSEVEKAVLRLCDGNVVDHEIAAMLGRPHQGVRCKLTRLRKLAADRADAPRDDIALRQGFGGKAKASGGRP